MNAITREEWTLKGHDRLDLFARSWLPEGTPRDVVVIAHGYGEHGDRYGNVVERLVPAGYAVHAVDHRGHGRSGGRRALIDRMDRAIDDFHGFVEVVRERHGDARDGGGRVKLLGHSMGGSIALGYALRYPQDLSGLMLSGPAVGGFVPAGQRLVLRILSAVAPNLGTLALPASAVSRDPAVVEAYERDPLVHHGKVPARSAGEMVAAAAAYTARAGEMTLPVLIQHGAEDKLIPVGPNRAIYEALGAADKTVKIYPGLYHEIFNEPEHPEVIDDLLAWLAAHPAG